MLIKALKAILNLQVLVAVPPVLTAIHEDVELARVSVEITIHSN